MSKRDQISGSKAPSFVETKTLFGHPVGLMVLFFTEMWERFSYYGMRALLVLFLASTVNGGLGWTEGDALSLYGTYTMLVYLASIPGGILADKLIGQKRSVMLGGFTLVAGHFLMALPQLWAFYTALGLIIAGTGMLKPNISTMVGGLYREGDAKRDSGFTIFYMGINLGAFLSALIVGYVGETIGWHYGFSLAGFGMLLGQLVFIGGQKYLKGVGNMVKDEDKIFTEGQETYKPAPVVAKKVENDRMVLLAISFVIVLVFWAAFEQAGGLMNLYTKNYTDRYIGEEIAVNEYTTKSNDGVNTFAANALQEVLKNKNKAEVHSFGDFFSNLVSPKPLSFDQVNDTLAKPVEAYFTEGFTIPATTQVGSIPELLRSPDSRESLEIADSKYIKQKDTNFAEFSKDLSTADYKEGSLVVYRADSGEVVPSNYLSSKQYVLNVSDADSATYNGLMDDSKPLVKTGSTLTVYDRQNDQPGFLVPASWFQSLNALFILIFGGVMASLWLALAKRGKNPPSIAKMGIGTAVMGAGFIFMVFAALQREESLFGMSSMWWLVLAYLFHTLGELALSPVALSYITKLAPKRLVASIMGIYFAVTGLGNKAAALLGEAAQDLGELEIFGGIAAVTIVLGTILALLSKRLNKLSHGAEDDKPAEEKAQTSQLLEAELS